jgi:hypothetical protein
LNHGTLISGTAYDTGKVGQAFNLDGVNDRVQVADSESLKLTASMTIEAWVKADALPVQQGEIFFRGDDRGGQDPYSLSLQSNGSLRWEVVSLTDAMNISTPMQLGELVHVAATLDDASGAMRLYVNGVQAAQTITTVRPFRDLDPGSNPGIGIGNHGGYPNTPHNFPWDGLIDELSVYNRALTAAEIAGIYNAGSDGKIKSPIYFTADTPSVAEGPDGTTTSAVFTIQRVGSTAGQATVNWSTTNGTATAGVDYVATSGQEIFQDGEAQKTVTVTVNGDNVSEPNETIELVLSTSTPGYGVGGGQATILDDDPGIAIGDATVAEGAPSTFLGEFVSAFSGGLARTGNAIFGPDGHLYVASRDNDSVLRYDGQSGDFLDVVVPSGAEGLDHPWFLAFGPDDKLYVAGLWSENIVRYDPASGVVDTFIPSGGALHAPKGMVFDADGNLYVANSDLGTTDTSLGQDQVLKFAGPGGGPLGEPAGTLLSVFIAPGSGGLDNPNHLAFRGGHLYVTNTRAATASIDTTPLPARSWMCLFRPGAADWTCRTISSSGPTATCM